MGKRRLCDECSIMGVKCSKQAQGSTDKCISHGGGPRCSEKDCINSAILKGGKCISHGGGPRCSVKDCITSAIFKGGKCKSHGGGHRCSEKDCINSARGGSDTCSKHGGGVRCPNCVDWIDSRGGKKKYDNYCATCFKNVFPRDKRSKKLIEKSHENKVRNYLNEHYNGFIHDSSIFTNHCNCTHRRRIDHRLLVGNTILAVETDERQHKRYDTKDEDDRIDDLYMAHSGKWCFIRFNPDSYRINGIKYNPDIKDRLPMLLAEINKQILRIKNDENIEPVETVKLYYDE